MPSAIRDLYSTPNHSPPRSGITKFTNCRVLRGNELVQDDLWISSRTGKVLDGQKIFFEYGTSADRVIDLGGRIISPGLIDVQLNGGFGFDFSVVPDDISAYAKGLQRLNKSLIETGVTSYLPTLTSQRSEVYHKVLPFLRPSSHDRDALSGAESLGAHCEGPFLSPTKNGIHKESVLRVPSNGFLDLEDCYGADNLKSSSTPIKLVTLAPEQAGALDAIKELRRRGIIVSIGHSEATFEEATKAIDAGADMITHLFNAMRPLHHRNPGIFGVLGTNSARSRSKKPFFGIIADGIHLHTTAVTIAWAAHPSGCILVTDATSPAGLPDGVYDWTNGERIRKTGPLLTLEGTDGKIAGSSITLIGCVNNFLNWTGTSVPHALGTVTSTPAKMLGLEQAKGNLIPGADADLVVLDEVVDEEGKKTLKVEQVWKFGMLVHDTNVDGGAEEE
ncbi:N-acetylglucosamine-6-phosphate deacetylase [Rhizodiscina lignyota]|uniref:N-acetylglucosamine-6-phosphate deacetylase n=1 Tax=Rhizodiscina lignyota TaxID=1504668 RepID=A0A9P4IG75_9PEZI|nr:N-acetylglucosamine-6-phosphate deacetylase [Rhizodiscina lignyota]